MLQDLVVPLSMVDVEYVTQNRDDFQKYLLPIPDLQTVSLCDNKNLFNDWLLNSEFKKHAIAEKQDPPFFLKPRIGAWGTDCTAILNNVDFDKHSQQIRSDEFVCQELIFGDTEYATHFVLEDGKTVNHLCIEYRFDTETPVKGSDTILSKLIVRDKFLPVWERLFLEKKFSGMCCLNYKISDGVPKILEINPRFGGSLAEHFICFVYSISQLARSRK